METQTVVLARRGSHASSTSALSPAPSPASDHTHVAIITNVPAALQNNISAGAAVGIIVAALAVFVSGAAIGFWVYTRRHRRRFAHGVPYPSAGSHGSPQYPISPRSEEASGDGFFASTSPSAMTPPEKGLRVSVAPPPISSPRPALPAPRPLGQTTIVQSGYERESGRSQPSSSYGEGF
ncbi:hypothetical protein KEM52_001743 [Ascosphaera acerosa]|nr:hypothetical protein KEM52_001743 [Ascosphaera acerosa]